MEPVSAHEQQFRDALPVIDGVVREIARRYHLSPDEREDFAGAVRLRLIADDYAVLRRFEGRSRLGTFLRTVITRQFLDERVKAWGRWRPSAEAVRLGPTAVALERLLECQRLGLDEAIETLRAREASLDDTTLRDLAARLPGRVTGRRLVGLETLTEVASPDPSPHEALMTSEADASRQAVQEALRTSMAALAPRERLLLRLRFEQGTSVADIARVLREDQKPLYRQLDRILVGLRRSLESRGISAAQVRMLTHLPLDVPAVEGGNHDDVPVSSMRAGMDPVA